MSVVGSTPTSGRRINLIKLFLTLAGCTQLFIAHSSNGKTTPSEGVRWEFKSLVGSQFWNA